MMNFIEIDQKKCDRCFKCLRGCPTKAIAFTDQSHHIVNALCVKCGLCQRHCPKHALTIQSDWPKVLRALSAGRKIAVSLAPSFTSAFVHPPRLVIEALYSLGFSYVEETAMAAEYISQAYATYIENKAPNNLLTTCCPSANLYIEQRYPELLNLLAPFVSPMILHGRWLKERLGKDCEVVFIGPCLAKKAEASDEQLSDAIDYVLTFNVVAPKINEYCRRPTGITAQGTQQQNEPTLRGLAYPMGSSLFDAAFEHRAHSAYRHIKAEGMQQLDDLLSSMHRGEMKGYCAEVSMCIGSCINGPDMPHPADTYYQRLDRATSQLEERKGAPEGDTEQLLSLYGLLRRQFEKKRLPYKSPSTIEIHEILVEMNKFDDDDLLNCGACGYDSCLDKAHAIYRGLAVKSMCLPYMKSIVEGLTYAIYDHSPNPICIVDAQGIFKAYNKAFSTDFGLTAVDIRDKSCEGLLPVSLFNLAAGHPEKMAYSSDSKHRAAFCVDYIDKYYVANTIWLEDQKAFLCILTDMSYSESQKRALQSLKEETLRSCESVIHRQMTMVQEVAGMLGESVAHSKVQLDQLKRLIEEEARDSYDTVRFP